MKECISPGAFVRLALAISALWFVAVYPALNGFLRDKLPRSLRPGGSDFAQYYSGALSARHGLWKQLYPQAKRDVYEIPPVFKPLVSTRLCATNAQKERQGNWAFYPTIASPAASDVAPEILSLCPELLSSWHYIYPPPLAIVLSPLGFFDYQTALNDIWFPLLSASYFGIGFFASRIYRGLANKVSYTEGWIALLPLIPCCLASRMSTTFQIGNASPLLGFLIAAVAHAWIHKRPFTVGLGIIPLILFKGMGLIWCLLLLLKPVKWKTLGLLALLTVLLNGSALYHGGTEPYIVFFRDIVPKATVPQGVGLPGMLMFLLGVNLKLWFGALNLLLLGGICWGYWRQRHCSHRHSIVAATLAGTMAVFCLCNPVVWPHHYFANYLQLPFAGWIVWEGFQAQGTWRRWIFGMFALSSLFWMDGIFLLRDSFLMERLKEAGMYSQQMNQARSALSGFIVLALPLAESSFLLALAYRRLFLAPRLMEEEGSLSVPSAAATN